MSNEAVEVSPFVTVRRHRHPDDHHDAAEYEPLTAPLGEEEEGQVQPQDQQYDDNVQQQYQEEELRLEEPDAEQQLDDYEAQERQEELLATEVEEQEYRDEQVAQFDQYYAEVEAPEEEMLGGEDEEQADEMEEDDGENLDDPNSSKEKLDVANQGVGMDIEDEVEEEIWIPPSMELAQEHVEKSVYQEGKGKFWRGDLTKATDLSRGVVLHFSFLRNMAICLSVMTVLSIPSLLFCTNGTRIPLALQDPIGLYKFTLGNIGYDPNSRTYLTDSACTQISDAKTYNGTCIHIQGKELKLSIATNIISMFEFLQVLAFFIFCLSFQYMILKEDNDDSGAENVSAKQYTIMVRNLPKDTSLIELVQHFSTLYALDQRDWNGRSAVQGTKPVKYGLLAPFPCRDFTTGTWIADAVLFRKIGHLIAGFKQNIDLMALYHRYQAQYLMYAEGTCFKSGPDPKRQAKAEEQMDKYKAKVQDITESLIIKHTKMSGKTPANEQVFKEEMMKAMEEGKRKQSESGMKLSRQESMDMESQVLLDNQDPCAAFITFEYRESHARCIMDYMKWSSLPRSLISWCFYPKQLKYKGHRLRVEEAPEPDEVIWENMEISDLERILRQIPGALLSTIFLIVSFAIIVQASNLKTLFVNKLPYSGLCNRDLPVLYNLPTTTVQVLGRPDHVNKTMDAACDKIIPGSFYGVYSKNSFQANLNDDEYRRLNYSMSACTGSLGICPKSGSVAYCPCISTTSTTVCSSQSCSLPSDQATLPCTTFAASQVGYCYCEAKLTALLSSSSSTVQTAQQLKTYLQSTLPQDCGNYLQDYAEAQGLTYGAIIISIVINMLVQYLINFMTQHECHDRMDSEKANKMVRVFAFYYFNMAFSVLIAYGFSASVPKAFAQAHIFQGPFPDFTSGWYAVVGVYFCTSFVLAIVTPVLTTLVTYYLVTPLSRAFAFPKVKTKSSRDIVTQKELNDLVVGPVFDPTMDAAHILGFIFFSMTYATGVPLLMPLAAVACLTYYGLNKIQLLRFERRPPKMGSAMVLLLLRLLPLSAVIRLAFGSWMIGSSTVLSDFTIEDFPLSIVYKVPLTTYARWLNGLNTAAMTFTDTNLQLITDRLARPAVFPLFLLLLFVLALTVLKTIWKLLPISWVVLLFMKLFCKSKKEMNAKKIIEGGEPTEKSVPSGKEGSNPGSRQVSGINQQGGTELDTPIYPSEKPSNVTLDIEASGTQPVGGGVGEVGGGYDGGEGGEAPHSVNYVDEWAAYNAYWGLTGRDPRLTHYAPFAGEYYTRLTKKAANDPCGCTANPACAAACRCCFRVEDPFIMSPEEKEEGWETVCGQEPYDVEPFGKQKRWMKGLMVDELKRTYEVIDENGCRSYRLEDIPLYANVIAEMKEGIYLEANDVGDDDDEEVAGEEGKQAAAKSGKKSRKSKKSSQKSGKH